MASPTDSSQRTTLLCRNIPAGYTRRVMLREHFEKFGVVKNVMINVEKGVALIEFENHEQAVQARQLGTSIAGHEIQILWKRNSTRSITTTPEAEPKTLLGSSVKQEGIFSRQPQLSGTAGTSLKASQSDSQRSPVQPDLYDDLPPPSNWEEEPTAGTSTSANPTSVSPKRRLSTKSVFGKKRRSTETATLFGKSIKKEPKSAGSTPLTSRPVIRKPGASLFGQARKRKEEPSSDITSSIATNTQTAEEIAEAAIQHAIATEDSEPVNLTAESTGFSAELINFTTQPTDPVTLFGKHAGQSDATTRSTVFARLSPAKMTISSRSISPVQLHPSTVHTTQPLAQSRSPQTISFTKPAQVISQEIDQVPQEVEWILPDSMVSLRQTPAQSCSERQAVLDKRERLLRQGTSKESDISKARATKGCCPDMCPERERYLREERRRVHSYEMVPGTEAHPQMDHSKAVKEYSRSSADQDEPLPLELRPTPVLTVTMQYLCNNILDIGTDSTWGDWYDFMWNRTRAIRKDVTQQHLCNVEATGLVEKCARFHIYCAERLIEEEARNFDTKINNENLTKCLQTLKEMYADLLKKGVTCPKEAEFRAYVVLMNLNEGDTLREVQQLRAEVRNSPAIRFALSAYESVNSKNYIKFFKLVKKTTFLNACILHRYFNQMRYEALKIILRSYYSKLKGITMSFDQFKQTLHFEDTSETNAFLQHYGIYITATTPGLNKDSFTEPDSLPPLRRSPKLVESKLHTSVGEAVYGAPLPPNVLGTPSSSFDARGYFIGIIKPPAVESLPSTPVAVAEVVKLPPLSEISNDVVKDCVKAICLEVIDDQVQEVIKETSEDENAFVECCSLVVTDITHKVVQEEKQTLAEAVLAEEQQIQRAKLKAETDALLTEICEQQCDRFVAEVVDEECQRLATQALKDVQHQLYRKHEAECGQALGRELIHEQIVDLLTQIAEEVYQADVLDRIKLLEQCEAKVRVSRTRKYFHLWKNALKNRTHMRRLMVNFPSAPPLCVTKPKEEGLWSTGDGVSPSKRNRPSLMPALIPDLDKHITLNTVVRKIGLAYTNSPLNMRTIVEDASSITPAGTEYIQLSVLLGKTQCEQDRQLSSWICAKLSHPSSHSELNTSEGQLLSLYNFTVNVYGYRRPVPVSVRCFHPDDMPSSGVCRSLFGSNMFIYLLPFTARPTEVYWRQVREELNSMITCKPPVPAVPLLIISTLEVDKEQVQYRLGVYELLESAVLSHIRVERLDSTIQYNDQLVRDVQWLVENRPKPPDLMSTDIKSLLETELTSRFFCPVQAELYSRLTNDLLHPNPKEVIYYYNLVLGGIVADLEKQNLYIFSWPPYDITSSASGHTYGLCRILVLCVAAEEGSFIDYTDSLNKIKSILSLKLPDITDCPADLDCWADACYMVHKYMKKITTTFPSINPSQLTTQIQLRLDHAESLFQSRCRSRFHLSHTDIRPLAANMPWVDIIVCSVEQIISSLEPRLELYCKPMDSSGEPSNLPITGRDRLHAAIHASVCRQRCLGYTALLYRKASCLRNKSLEQPASKGSDIHTYSRSMEVSLDRHRNSVDFDVSLHLEEEVEFFPRSFIDLKSDLHTELEASEQFKNFIASHTNAALIDDELTLADKLLAKPDEEEDDNSLAHLLQQEKHRSLRFEQFLKLSLGNEVD